MGRQGIEPWATRLKVGDSATELTARRYWSGPGFFVIAVPSVRRAAGLEPAHFLLIRQAPSPAWPPPRSESRHRTDDLRVMGAALWPTELSRRSWPPRNRTAHYLCIGQTSSTSWVWPAEGGGVDPPGVTLHGLSKPVAAAGGAPSRSRERRSRPPPPRGGQPFSKRSPPPGRFTLRAPPRIRTGNLLGLGQATLPSWSRRACE